MEGKELKVGVRVVLVHTLFTAGEEVPTGSRGVVTGRDPFFCTVLLDRGSTHTIWWLSLRKLMDLEVLVDGWEEVRGE